MAVPAERERVVRLETRAREAETALQQLRSYVELLRRKSAEPDTAAVKVAAEHLECENRQLRGEVERLKKKLVTLEIKGGVPQVSLPSSVATTPPSIPEEPLSKPVEHPPPKRVEEERNKESEKGKKGREKKEKTASRGGGGGGGSEKAVDVSRLDFRIGKILKAWKHPDADTLYVEEVDIGEENPRSVCSGLAKHVPLEEMQGRLVVMLCNLKPVKMRGVTSEAMVMCASSPEQVQILDPPPDSIPGERISCEGFTGPPDAVLNPKKKVFETVQPELHTNEEGVACYRGIPLMVAGKGVCQAATMRSSGIK